MGLFDLPKSTEFGRVIPKNAFDEYTNTNQKKLISDSILRITWTHKLSPETTNLKAKDVKEIQLFLIELKVKSDLKNILKIIDKAIPYHILFTLQFQNECKVSTSAKHDHQNKSNESVIDGTFDSDWIPSSELDFTIILKESLDTLFISFCDQLSGRNSSKYNYAEFVAREIEIKTIESNISKLENKVKKEKQFNNKVNLNLALCDLKKELALKMDSDLQTRTTPMLITKSDFKIFQTCPESFWLYKKDRDKIPPHQITEFQKALSEQGHRVEEYAQLLFSDGVLIRERGEEGIRVTEEEMKSSSIIFQAGFSADDLYTRCDVIKWNEKDAAWDIYEIKASTSKETPKADHYWDLAFQREVLLRAGIKVSKLYLIALDTSYRREGRVDVSRLFKLTDITEQIDTMVVEIQTAIGTAKKELSIVSAPATCTCSYKPKSKHCLAFDYFHPDVPDYSIYNISRVSAAKLAAFKANGILAISDIPEEYDLTDIQHNQVLVHNNEFEIININAIKTALDTLVYPLYFLDYETYPAAIPVFDHCTPYQQVPFQFSLHIQASREADLTHKEYLHLGDGSPIPPLAQRLREVIGDTGSVLVWNKSFETLVNKAIAEQIPNLADFLFSVNERMFDLEVIFSKQHVVKKAFSGKTSIKKVLPALVPHLSYNDLSIQDGGAASNTWKKVYFGDLEDEEANQIVSDLLAYCKLDTLAMVEILNYLKGAKV